MKRAEVLVSIVMLIFFPSIFNNFVSNCYLGKQLFTCSPSKVPSNINSSISLFFCCQHTVQLLGLFHSLAICSSIDCLVCTDFSLYDPSGTRHLALFHIQYINQVHRIPFRHFILSGATVSSTVLSSIAAGESK